MDQLKTKRRGVILAHAVLFISAVLCLQTLLVSSEFKRGGNRGISHDDNLDYDAQLHRYLLQTLDESNLMDDFGYVDQFASTDENESPIGTNNHPALTNLTGYSLQDAINEAHVFRVCFLVLVYDPDDDKFYGYYSKNHLWRTNFAKLQQSVRYLTFMLRRTFPERFTPTTSEFAVAVSSGDYPHVHLGKLPHQDGIAPVLQFGSAFRQTHLYPNMVWMQLPAWHLACFAQWVGSEEVCSHFRPINAESNGELAFGRELGLEWDTLTVRLCVPLRYFLLILMLIAYLCLLLTNAASAQLEGNRLRLFKSVDAAKTKSAAW
ncbi:hypothetical protein ACHAWF_008144 [Thalassiosira exigua]